MANKVGRSTKWCGLSSHNIGLALASSGLLFTNSGQALTIGNPQIASYLAQPLQVFVPVTKLEPGKKPGYYTIRALPASEYGALGLPQPDFPIQDFQFNWVDIERGEAQILVSSRRPITEPVVTVLLEIRGAKQRWVRQLDFLLDPPPAGEARAKTELKTGPIPTNSAPLTAHTQIDSVEPSSISSINNGLYGPVRQGEVLSVIAQNVRMDPKIPLTQMAQAILNVNQAAFPDGPRSLSAGAMLNIPTAQQIARAPRNEALMAPPESPPQQTVRSSHSKNEADDTNPSNPASFLPKSRYLNGHFYPLTIQFLSYEDIRPIDLQPTLQALEAAEPIRFRADWTLSGIADANNPSSASLENAQDESQSIESTLPLAKTQESESVLQTAAIETIQKASDQAPVAKEVSQPPAEGLNRAQYYYRAYESESGKNDVVEPALTSTDVNSTNLSATARSDLPSARTTAPSVQAALENDKPISWLWWLLLPLLLIPAAAAFAWSRGWRWELAKLTPAYLRQLLTAEKANEDYDEIAPHQQPLSRSPEDDIVRQALKRRLKPALDSADENIARRAKVALALYDRGRIEEAKIRIDELEAELEARKKPEQPSSTVRQKTEPVKKFVKPQDPAENSELEQRRVLKAIRKLLNTTLSNESERQLKVAAALCERGNIERAQHILEQVKKEQPEQESDVRSVS